jgi:energy-converting hydrogenase Eha subunit C
VAVSGTFSTSAAVLFASALWDWKQKANRLLVFSLIAIGLVGVSGAFVFSIALVAVFFPKVSIISFMLADFTAVAVAGVFLSIFGRLPLPNDR